MSCIYINFDTGRRESVTITDRDHIKDIEPEDKELRRTNEILKIANAFFA